MRMENEVETAMRKEIDELSTLPVGQLRQKYLEVFEAETDSKQDDDLPPGSASGEENQGRPRGRRPLPAHLKRERIEHERSRASATNTFPRSCW